MATQTAVELTIPDLYKRNALNLSLFSFVRGVRSALHTVTVREAIFMFAHDYGLDDYNVASAEATYYRMQKELIQTKSNISPDE